MKRILLLALLLVNSVRAECWFQYYVTSYCCPETTNHNDHRAIWATNTEICAPAQFILYNSANGVDFDTVTGRDPNDNKYAFCGTNWFVEGATNAYDIYGDVGVELVNPVKPFLEVRSRYPDLCSLHPTNWVAAVVHYDGRWNSTPSRHWELETPIEVNAGKPGVLAIYYVTNTGVQAISNELVLTVDIELLQPSFPPPWPHLRLATNGLIWTINNLPNAHYKVSVSQELSGLTNWATFGDTDYSLETGFIEWPFTNAIYADIVRTNPALFFSGYGVSRDQP